MALVQTFLHSLFKLPHRLYDQIFIKVVSYNTINLPSLYILFQRRKVWLAIRFKIMTSCTWAFLPRIIVYNRYVWAFIPYTTIYIAYIRVFNTRICAKSNARLYALLKTRIYAYLSKPTYTRAKMCIYAGFRNQTWYKMARKVPLTE